MNNDFGQQVMRPGDTFVSDECECSFTVESGPSDPSMVRQAPVCCCGHFMHKEMQSSLPGTPIDARTSHATVSETHQDASVPNNLTPTPAVR